MKMKKIVAVLLTCAMAVSLAACGSGSTSTGETGNTGSTGETGNTSSVGGTESAASSDDAGGNAVTASKGSLIVGLYGGTETLNPWASGRITKDMVTYVLYETLASCQSGSTDLDNILMKDYKRVDDTTFDIDLYDYITDAEGNNIKASDVVFSFEQYDKNWATTIESIKATGDYTVELKLNTTAKGSFEYLVCKVPIASETAYNNSPDQFSTTSCGTMPYVVAGGSDYVAGTKIIARKTASYWQKDASLIYKGSAANADTIEFDILEESIQMALAIENGTIDFAMYINPSMLDEVTAVKNLMTYAVPSSEDRGIQFCMTEDSPFYNNLPLRQAVLYAIDNQAVADACGYGYADASKVTCGNADLTIGYDPSWETSPYAYDTNKAKELLTESGYNGETLRLLANSNETITTMWQIIQANLADVGIKAELNVCEGTTYGAYRDGTSGQYEMAYAGPGNAGYATQDLWNTLFNRNNYDSGKTWAGLSDDTLQSMYDILAKPDGYTQDNVNLFYKYITDNAYYYQIYSLPDCAAYDTDKVSDFFIDQNRFVRANTIVLK
ncbi:MAG: ABC transporter substrate-binding protein [Lacrimispora sp.]